MKQPARMSNRGAAGLRPGTFETTEFAKARDKRRRARDLAKAARKRQR